jgi:hypothetical protein
MPISADLIVGFFAGLIATGILSIFLLIKLEYRQRVILVACAALAGGTFAAGLMTVVALAIDDWSACRLMPAVAILYGYPLYATANDPANGFLYGPFGAWVYLPAATVAKALISPSWGLWAGILTSFLLMCAPVARLISSGTSIPGFKWLAAILAASLFVALPPLRYVAFSIHVDAVGLASSALAIVSAAMASRTRLRAAVWCGLFIGLAVFSKQTFIPAGGVCFILLSLTGPAALLRAGIAFILLITTVLAVLAIGGSMAGMLDLYVKFFYGVPSRMTLFESVIEMIPPLAIQGAVILVVWIAAGANCPQIRKWPQLLIKSTDARISFGLLFAAIGFIPVGAVTSQSIGGDVNHYAIAIYFLLLLSVYWLACIPREISEHSRVPWLVCLALMIPTVATLPYLQKFPGWYLFHNNFLEHAMEYSKENPGTVYFPWQPLSVLLAEGRLYHFGTQLSDELLVGRPRHSREQYLAHLPGENVPVALRPYGAPAPILPIVFPEHRLCKDDELKRIF